MKKNLVSAVAILLLTQCGGGSGNVTNEGYVALAMREVQDFNPNAQHGEVVQYRVTITSDALPEPVVRYYDAGTSSATLDGFENGTVITIEVEYLNSNGLVVRRGLSEDVTIRGGATVSASLDINNVPIFANVRDGALVYNTRFVPEIFAPGGIQFQVADSFDASESILTDEVSSLSSFSVNDSENPEALLSIHAAPLPLGEHSLVVRDTDTGEASTITVTVLDGSEQIALNTTAGDYIGSMLSPDNDDTNLILYFERLAQ